MIVSSQAIYDQLKAFFIANGASDVWVIIIFSSVRILKISAYDQTFELMPLAYFYFFGGWSIIVWSYFIYRIVNKILRELLSNTQNSQTW